VKEEGDIFAKHNQRLIKIISEDIGVSPESIIDLELSFADAQPACYFGLDQDFISAPRIDNLFSSYHALLALAESTNQGTFINMAAIFDHEECGSESTQGASSPTIIHATKRIFKLLSGHERKADDFDKTLQKSFLISADMAHSIHPNYSDKHHANHQVEINKGVVIKTNHNQRYSSDLVSSSLFKIIAKEAKVPVQEFIVRNDSPCGTTIGPILSAKTGIKTVDVGCPMLGMHSIR
jgi:aspartyl aminopeptidase